MNTLPRDILGYFDYKITSVSLSSTKSKIANMDPDRVHLIISLGSGLTTAFILPDASVTDTRCIVITSQAGNIQLSHRDCGGLVAQEWWGLANPGPVNATVVETILRRDPNRKAGLVLPG